MASNINSSINEEESTLEGPIFDPPLYKQRYREVVNIARRIKPKKVVDMGCAECKLLRQLKREPYIEQLVGVDFDPMPLKMNEHIVHPLTTDYLMPRTNPLRVTLMQEHLDPDILELVPQSVFGLLRPSTVVVTTPNADYNVLFPCLTGFRHHDHRFEWTKEQFKAWCLSVVRCYPGYSVEVGGVGAAPKGSEGLGYCSQLAVFTRKYSEPHNTDHLGTPYTIICSADHPYAPPLPPLHKLCQEAEYYLNVLLKSKRDEILNTDHFFDNNHPNGSSGDLEVAHNEESDTLSIRLTDLLVFPKIRALCSSDEEIRDALRLSSLVVLNAAEDSAVFPMDQEVASDTSSDDEYNQ